MRLLPSPGIRSRASSTDRYRRRGQSLVEFAIVLPILLLLTLVVWRRFRRIVDVHSRTARLFALGFSIHVISVFGTELLSNLVGRGSMAGVLQVAVEETGENIGATFMVWAGIELLRDAGIRIRSVQLPGSPDR